MVAIIEFERRSFSDDTVTAVAAIVIDDQGIRRRRVLVLTEKLTDTDLSADSPLRPDELQSYARPESLLRELLHMLCDRSPESFFGTETSVYLTHMSEIHLLGELVLPFMEPFPSEPPRLLLPMYLPMDCSTRKSPIFRQLVFQLRPCIYRFFQSHQYVDLKNTAKFLGLERTSIPFDQRRMMSEASVVLHNGELVMDVLERIVCQAQESDRSN